MKRATLLGAICALFLLTLLIGCNSAEPEETDPPTTAADASDASEAESEAAEPTVAPTETPTPRPTAPPTPTLTPIPPVIRAQYQLVSEDGSLIIDEVIAPENGWLIAVPSSSLNPDETDLLGAVQVGTGPQENVALVIPAEWDEPSVTLALIGGRSGDQGEPEAFTSADFVLIQLLEIDTMATIPSLTIDDVEIGFDGIITLTHIFSQEPGWVTVYAASDTDRTNMLGYAPVKAGDNPGIELPIRWREGETALTAYLRSDIGRVDVFEPESDPLIEIDGDPISAEFSATFPPEIIAYHQPAIGGVIEVEQIYSQGDGWLVVYEDANEDGLPGFIIGQTRIVDGINTNLTINLNQTVEVAPMLMLTFHDDTGTLDEFDFPGNDPLRFYRDNPFFVSIETDLGPLMVTNPEPVTEIDNQTVAIFDLIMIEADSWLVIYNDDEGDVGETELGRIWLPAGITRDLPIPFELPESGARVHALLRTDNGVREAFEPDGFDFPTQYDGSNISLPITLP